MTEEKNTVLVEFYNLSIIEYPENRFRKVIISKSIDEGDPINMAKKRQTEFNPTTQATPSNLRRRVNSAAAKVRGRASAGTFINPVTDVTSDEVNTTRIPVTSILLNDPSKISFVMPADIPAGNYKPKIVTQFITNKNLLKEARTYVFDYPLTAI